MFCSLPQHSRDRGMMQNWIAPSCRRAGIRRRGSSGRRSTGTWPRPCRRGCDSSWPPSSGSCPPSTWLGMPFPQLKTKKNHYTLFNKSKVAEAVFLVMLGTRFSGVLTYTLRLAGNELVPRMTKNLASYQAQKLYHSLRHFGRGFMQT